MNCNTPSYDNRETCTEVVPSSCVPYTGYVSTTITDLSCRPNVNDIIKKLQELVDGIKTGLGDNTILTASCLSITPATIKQVQLNQLFITEICQLKAALLALPESVDPATIILAVNLLCLLDAGCPPQSTYTLTEIINKLIVNYCNLLGRVQHIESILNI